jgi:hypothetical protein
MNQLIAGSTLKSTGNGCLLAGEKQTGQHDRDSVYINERFRPLHAARGPYEHGPTAAARSQLFRQGSRNGFLRGFPGLTTIVVPTITLSRLGQLVLGFTFVVTLILGAFATIRHRAFSYLVVVLATSTFGVDVIADNRPSRGIAILDTTLKLACLAILVSMTLKRTLRPGRVTVHRVIGGIAGYLLIGYTWTFAYQLLVTTGARRDSLQSWHREYCLRAAQPFDLLQLCNPHDRWLRRCESGAPCRAIVGRCRSARRAALSHHPDRVVGGNGAAWQVRWRRPVGPNWRAHRLKPVASPSYGLK